MAKKTAKKKTAPTPKSTPKPKSKLQPAAARNKPKRKTVARRSRAEIIAASKPANTNAHARPRHNHHHQHRKRSLSKARRNQLAFARKKNFERQVTEKTLRDILALRCVQRCTHA